MQTLPEQSAVRETEHGRRMSQGGELPRQNLLLAVADDRAFRPFSHSFNIA